MSLISRHGRGFLVGAVFAVAVMLVVCQLPEWKQAPDWAVAVGTAGLAAATVWSVRSVARGQRESALRSLAVELRVNLDTESPPAGVTSIDKISFTPFRTDALSAALPHLHSLSAELEDELAMCCCGHTGSTPPSPP